MHLTRQLDYSFSINENSLAADLSNLSLLKIYRQQPFFFIPTRRVTRNRIYIAIHLFKTRQNKIPRGRHSCPTIFILRRIYRGSNLSSVGPSHELRNNAMVRGTMGLFLGPI